ncbi:MAG: hypothetical protein GY696_05565 [Gammaproteobacteria bacterium]|nr:hypothetical protein [Gammaproteobacteria bacterium]
MGPKEYKRVELDQIPHRTNVPAADQLEAPAMLFCARTCGRTGNCKTFAFNEATGTCKLYAETLAEIGTALESEEGTNIWIETA